MSSDPRPTKNQRREEARVAAERLKAEQAASARKSRTVAIIALIAGIAVLGGLVVWIFAEGNKPTTEGLSAPAGATVSGGIPVGQDGVAGTRGGSAEDATVIQVYFDFMCPYCGLFETTNAAELEELRATGDVVVEYHPVSILDRLSMGTGFSSRSATAAAFVADRAPEAFVDFLTVMLANQPAENTGGLSDAQMAAFAADAGAGEAVTSAIADGTYFTGEDSLAAWVIAATEQAGKDLPRLATPTIVIDGEVLDTQQYNWTEPGALTRAVADARG